MMAPKLYQKKGYTFFFWSSEVLQPYEPSHVHVRGENGSMEIWIPSCEIKEVKGFSKVEQKVILEITKKHAEEFLKKWNECKKRSE